MFSTVNDTFITQATDYLIKHATTEPTFWENHTPDLNCSLMATKDGTCDRTTKGKLTRIFQAAIDKLSLTVANEFSLKAFQCRQGATGLMDGLGLTLDLDPLSNSVFSIKLGSIKIEVSPATIRHSAYLRTIIGTEFNELKTGVIDLTTNQLTNVSLEAWQLYFSDTVLQKGWTKDFFDQPVLLSELFQFAHYLQDHQTLEDCISKFKSGIKTYKYEKQLHIPILRERIATVLGVLSTYGRDDVIKTLMWNQLEDTSSGITPLLQETQTRGIDIQHLALQGHNERGILDYSAELDKIAALCPNLKSLDLTVPSDAEFSRLPNVWKTSLVHLIMGHNAKKLPIEALDHMPNLEHIWFREEGRILAHEKYKCIYPNPYPRDPIGCPKLISIGNANPDYRFG